MCERQQGISDNNLNETAPQRLCISSSPLAHSRGSLQKCGLFLRVFVLEKKFGEIFAFSEFLIGSHITYIGR